MIIGPIDRDVWRTLLAYKRSIINLKEQINPPKKRLETEEYVYRNIVDSFYKQ